ncbi:WD repeat-containing protein 75 [Contarinia nasturtii]|uniref:WD repeat-containing protein 75 n=1 Tax=Contarinia nasturtii TaxID=265458 RepID=UPI0012D458B0|nr:WD repeat-containing protein 75 [Contarinia nasturtii]
MVCFVNDSFSKEDTKMTTNKPDDTIDDLTIDENAFLHLKLQRIAGGSVIEFPPTFSPHGDSLFVISHDHILVYSSTTGEYVRELEGISGKKIIAIQCDPNNSKLLYGCTESGDIISWKWKSGVINEKHFLRISAAHSPKINTFSLIPMKDASQTYGLITWRRTKRDNVQIGIFNLLNGLQEDVKLPLKLAPSTVRTAVAPGQNYFVVIQDKFLYCVNYVNGDVKLWTNIQGDLLTCVACHPTQQVVATGDVKGRILLYREIFRKVEPKTTLYHWHHTPVTTVTFTESGSNFYSGGLENTLCHWDIRQQKPIGFVPRMQGTPVHIVIGAENRKISVATDDNGIQIFNAQNNVTAVIQNFTWIPYDKTNIPKFPIGLKVNPRTNSLVLNGRLGHLQFFSTYTRTLLYNLDTTAQNRLNIEAEKILYNLYVSHASLNEDWLATAEILDDHEHTIECRLKFWKFDDALQKYSLNTQIELPHENGVRTLEFSTLHSVDNLLCASSGEYDVKIWALEDSPNYKKKGKVWTCIARASYKNLPIKSLGFSSDTSLLGVGFGNTLCIYNSETLHLRCALSAPSGLDGSVNKMTITLPKSNDKTNLDTLRQHFVEKRKKLLSAIRSMLETDEAVTVTRITNSVEKLKPVEQKLPANLSEEQKKMIFNQVLASNSINLFQKIHIFDKFNLHGRIPAKSKKSYTEYCEQIDNGLRCTNVLGRMLNLSTKQKFKFAHKYNQSNLQKQRSRHTLDAFKRVINCTKTTAKKTVSNGVTDDQIMEECSAENEIKLIHPQKPTVHITHVAFCTGEFAHLVIVCTEKRLLIWNLLTLRIQSAFKVAVEKLNVDLYTSLVAIVAKNHDLFVFLPNTPITLYQHKQLPKIDGLAWIPRQHPRNRSLTVDWQAHTELYFLSSDKQELLRLVSTNDEDSYNSNAFYLSDNVQTLPNTPFAAMIAKQQTNYAIAEDKRSTVTYGIGVPGKDSVKELTSLQAHTMAPMNLFCTSFLKSLLVKEDTTTKPQRPQNDADDDEDNQMHSDDDD